MMYVYNLDLKLHLERSFQPFIHLTDVLVLYSTYVFNLSVCTSQQQKGDTGRNDSDQSKGKLHASFWFAN